MAIFMRTGDTNALDISSRSKVIAPNWFQRTANWIGLVALLSLLCLSTGCTQSNPPIRLLDLPDRPTGSEVRSLSGDIKEVAPPAIFLDLATLASELQPQVEITSPKFDQVMNETKVAVQIKLKGLSIYKEKETQLGPHLKVILDNQPAQDIYTLDEPIEFADLSPGSHTLRAFAVLPWGESFKNTTAYSQTTFHILAKTEENSPAPEQPLLTYNEPQGNFGAQPVLLDFYLNNAPLHLVAEESAEDDIQDWKIRCTVNGQSFLFDQWQPIYLKGFKPGQNWVQIELIDEEGDRIKGPFNSTVRLINYDPDQRDTLSKLVRGELPIEQVGQIVLPDYVPPVPAEAPAEELIETEEPVDDSTLKESIEPSVEQEDLKLKEDLELQENLDLTEPAESYSSEREAIAEPESQPAVDLYERIDKNERKETEDLPTNQIVPIEKDSSVDEDGVEPQTDEQLLDSAEEEDPLAERSPSLEETRSLENSSVIPDNLSAPASEIEIDFLDEPEDATTVESSPIQLTPEADNSETTTRPEPTETTPLKETELSQPGFLEQLKTRWRAFQKGQIESQSKTIQPSSAPIPSADVIDESESQIESARSETTNFAKPDDEIEIDSSTTEVEVSSPLDEYKALQKDAVNLEPAPVEQR